MRYLSVCSGIGSDHVAWGPLGWECAAFAEIDRQASAVLEHRFPGIPNVGDFTAIGGEDHGPVDLLVGGTPCQSFSVAGLRGGLDDDRGNLALEFCRLAGRVRPRWIVWENVPGVLSVVDGGVRGGAFLSIVRALAELGYGVFWRVLDAQYVRVGSHPRAVPQRRRRVFLVGYLGDWRPPVAVLLEPEGLRGDSPPRREAAEDVAGSLTKSLGRRGGQPNGAVDQPLVAGPMLASSGGMAAPERAGELVAYGGNRTSGPVDVATARSAHGGPHGRLDFESETFVVAHALRAEGFDASEDGTGRGTPIVAFSCKDHGADAGEVSPTLRAMPHDKSHPNAGGQVAVAFDARQDPCVYGEASGSLNCETPQSMAVLGLRGNASEPLVSEDVMPAANSMMRECAVAFAENSRAEVRLEGGDGAVAGSLKTGGGKPGQSYPVVMVSRTPGSQLAEEVSLPLRSDQGSGGHSTVASGLMVRRITPLEAERLMGQPDGWTLVPYRGKPMKDGPRYRLIGNGIAINVLRLIGERIAMFERLAA